MCSLKKNVRKDYIIYNTPIVTGRDQNDCFQRLFKYPPIESSLTLIQLANKIKVDNEEKIKAGVVVERKKKQTEDPKAISPIKKTGTGKKEVNENGNNETKPEKIRVNGPLLNGNIIHLGNKELLNEIDTIFKKYKFAMEIPDVGNYELAMETLRKKISNNN